MKLKQRLIFASICGLIFFITKPLWSWEEQEWRPRGRENHRLVHREEWDQLVHRENQGFLHSKLHHAEFENKKALAHAAAVAQAAQAAPVAPSKNIETMKSVANPLLTAKAAAPISIQKPVDVEKALVDTVKVAAPQSVFNNEPDVPAVSDQLVEKPPSAAPKSSFPSIKIDISLSDEEIEKEMERIKVRLSGEI